MVADRQSHDCSYDRSQDATIDRTTGRRVLIAQRIEFKVLTQAYARCRAQQNSTVPIRSYSYIIMLHNYAPSRTLCSVIQSLAMVPKINLERYGRAIFLVRTLWNALPIGLRTEQDPDRFMRDLKTHLFNVAFS